MRSRTSNAFLNHFFIEKSLHPPIMNALTVHWQWEAEESVHEGEDWSPALLCRCFENELSATNGIGFLSRTLTLFFSLYLSIGLYLTLSVCLCLSLPVCLCPSLSVCLYLSVCLSACLSQWSIRFDRLIKNRPSDSFLVNQFWRSQWKSESPLSCTRGWPSAERKDSHKAELIAFSDSWLQANGRETRCKHGHNYIRRPVRRPTHGNLGPCMHDVFNYY